MPASQLDSENVWSNSKMVLAEGNRSLHENGISIPDRLFVVMICVLADEVDSRRFVVASGNKFSVN